MYIYIYLFIYALERYYGHHLFCSSITTEKLIIVILIFWAYSYMNISSILYNLLLTNHKK